MDERKQVFRGQRLKEVRERRGFTQDDLQSRLGFGNTQIHRYETGKSEPSPEALVKLSKELNVTADYLLGLVDNPNEYLTDEPLTPGEARLIALIRSQDTIGSVRAVTDLLAEHK